MVSSSGPHSIRDAGRTRNTPVVSTGVYTAGLQTTHFSYEPVEFNS